TRLAIPRARYATTAPHRSRQTPARANDRSFGSIEFPIGGAEPRHPSARAKELFQNFHYLLVRNEFLLPGGPACVRISEVKQVEPQAIPADEIDQGGQALQGPLHHHSVHDQFYIVMLNHQYRIDHALCTVYLAEFGHFLKFLAVEGIDRNLHLL